MDSQQREARIALILLWAAGLSMLFGGVLMHFYDVPGSEIVYADREANAWAWYSSALLVLLAVVFVASAAVVRRDGAPWRAYLALAVVAAAMSMDESAALHERLANVVDSDRPFAWVPLGGLVAVTVGTVAIWVARAIPGQLRSRLVVAGLLFFAGALGVEAVTGMYIDSAPSVASAAESAAYHLLVVTEEGLELVGILLALRAAASAVAVAAQSSRTWFGHDPA